MKLVEVYKSERKPGSYLYVERGTDLDQLPEGLKAALGTPESVLSLKLTAERQLARYTGAEVLKAIEEKGFFLQLPPEHPAVEVAARTTNADR